MVRIKTLPILVFAMSIAAIAMIVVLERRADGSRQAQVELGQVGTQESERSNLPIQAMFGVPASQVRAQMTLLRQNIEATLGSLQSGTPVPALAKVRAALDRNFAFDNSDLALLSELATKQGRVELARLMMANGGMPPAVQAALGQARHNSLLYFQALDEASAQYASRASSQKQQATIGSIAVIALLVLAFELAYRRARRARAEAERFAAENARMAEANRHEALTDALTSLGNRRALMSALDAAIADGDPTLLVLFDLDGFKQYNDTFGHQSGDALLKRLGERLGSELEGEATSYRMGGDEFCVLARVDVHGAEAIAVRGAAALSEKGEAFAIGCSFGVALAPSETRTTEETLRLADQRMYEQKAVGRRASATRQTTDVLVQVLAEQNGQLAEHVGDVARLAASTAQLLGMSDFEVKQVHVAAQLHDIGKSAIPDTILNKPGPLDDDEWEFIRRHTLVGERIVRAATALSHAAPLIRSSHERVDGNGYPDGLHGEAIPLGARIIAVCDAYDAMVAERPYRPRIGAEQALEELRRCAGTQFDPLVVDEFARLVLSLDVPQAA
jgi:diguanylate cyclase (GGDEF)-like protein